MCVCVRACVRVFHVRVENGHYRRIIDTIYVDLALLQLWLSGAYNVLHTQNRTWVWMNLASWTRKEWKQHKATGEKYITRPVARPLCRSVPMVALTVSQVVDRWLTVHGHKYVSDVMHTYHISIPPALWYLVDRSDSAAVVSYDFFFFITQPGPAPRFLAQKPESAGPAITWHCCFV